MKLVFKFDGGRVVSHEVHERTFTIGRSEDCRVSIESEHFSREHCLVELIDKTVYLTDLDSKNGIYINHIRIPKRLKVNYDEKLPLYMGECFVTIDTSEDFRDKDYLSLETHVPVAPEEIFRPMDMPRRIAPRPTGSYVTKAEPQKNSGRKGLMYVLLIAAAALAYHHYSGGKWIPSKTQAATGKAP